MLSKWFDLELCTHPDFLLFSSFGHRHLLHNCTRIFYTGENARPNYRTCDYAFTFDRVEDERHLRLPLYKFYLGPDTLDHLASRAHRDPSPALEDRDFCSFVVTNPVNPLRQEFFHQLCTYRHVNSGGKLLNNVGGPVYDKRSFLKRHKFNIAFENASHPGYITEKLVDAFVSDTVPIFWGHPDVVQDFNPAAFINCHDFPNFDAAVEHVRQVDQDPALYASYLREPVFAGRRCDGNRFMEEDSVRERFETIFRSKPRQRPRRHLQKLEFLLRALRRLPIHLRRW